MVNAINDCRHGGLKSFGVPKVFGLLWTGTPFSQSEKIIFFVNFRFNSKKLVKNIIIIS
jgi:hypothetical protein